MEIAFYLFYWRGGHLKTTNVEKNQEIAAFIRRKQKKEQRK